MTVLHSVEWGSDRYEVIASRSARQVFWMTRADLHAWFNVATKSGLESALGSDVDFNTLAKLYRLPLGYVRGTNTPLDLGMGPDEPVPLAPFKGRWSNKLGGWLHTIRVPARFSPACRLAGPPSDFISDRVQPIAFQFAGVSGHPFRFAKGPMGPPPALRRCDLHKAAVRPAIGGASDHDEQIAGLYGLTHAELMLLASEEAIIGRLNRPPGEYDRLGSSRLSRPLISWDRFSTTALVDLSPARRKALACTLQTLADKLQAMTEQYDVYHEHTKARVDAAFLSILRMAAAGALFDDIRAAYPVPLSKFHAQLVSSIRAMVGRSLDQRFAHWPNSQYAAWPERLPIGDAIVFLHLLDPSDAPIGLAAGVCPRLPDPANQLARLIAIATWHDQAQQVWIAEQTVDKALADIADWMIRHGSKSVPSTADLGSAATAGQTPPALPVA